MCRSCAYSSPWRGWSHISRALLLAAAGLGVQAAHAAFAGLWFQCQPKWQAEKNFLLVDVKRGEAAWSAEWGVAHAASGRTEKDDQGNLRLRGCHAERGVPAKSCNPAQPPVFATLPKAIAQGGGAPADAALARGLWLRTDKSQWPQLARKCAALRPKKG